ncbi:MAG: hypothetical protein EB107_03595, partial [Proteobacteria bacterium]|nr:hypothetical protein [Pseudomonadota bacterium]
MSSGFSECEFSRVRGIGMVHCKNHRLILTRGRITNGQLLQLPTTLNNPRILDNAVAGSVNLVVHEYRRIRVAD